MPLTDLLWACPRCGTDRGLRPAGRHDFACASCGTRYRRDRAARIRATDPDGQVVVRDAGEWVDRLPDVDALVERAGEGVVRSARVEARHATETDVVRDGSDYLNRVEVFGPVEAGRLALDRDALSLASDRGPETRWGLERLTAVQASSTTLQVKVRQTPLVSFRFLDDSVFLWDLLLQAALRRFYHRTGRGGIVEFQPRIETRRGPGAGEEGG